MKIVLRIAVLLAVLVATSCSKSPKCWGDDVIKGIIVEQVSIRCFPVSSETRFIINSDSVFEKVFDASCVLPSVDFSKCTLLGLYAEGQCNVKYIREVSESGAEKKYHYKVIVKSCGTCKSMAQSYNWVTTPKLPPDWDVSFEVENK